MYISIYVGCRRCDYDVCVNCVYMLASSARPNNSMNNPNNPSNSPMNNPNNLLEAKERDRDRQRDRDKDFNSNNHIHRSTRPRRSCQQQKISDYSGYGYGGTGRPSGYQYDNNTSVSGRSIKEKTKLSREVKDNSMYLY